MYDDISRAGPAVAPCPVAPHGIRPGPAPSGRQQYPGAGNPCRMREPIGVSQVRQRVISSDDDANRQVWFAFDVEGPATEERRRLAA
jgi:hypothetical protein